MEAFRKSTWFTRGWTLQELLAPELLIFCNRYWEVIGHLCSSSIPSSKIPSCGHEIAIHGTNLNAEVSTLTNIPTRCLRSRKHIFKTSIGQRMSWASRRKTTRIEDEAYCLLGIFGINMPLIYGEGSKAFLRLQEEIVKRSNDMSIFAWSLPTGKHSMGRITGPVLAASPEYFQGFKVDVEQCHLFRKPYAMTNNGLEIRTRLSKAGVRKTQTLWWAGEVYFIRLNYSREQRQDGEWNAMEIPLRLISDRYYRIVLPPGEEFVYKLPRKHLGEEVIYLHTTDDIVDSSNPLWALG